MRANSAKSRNSAIGLIALVAIGCVQNRQTRVEKTPLASEQGGWVKKFPYLTSNASRQSVFDDPSQWPARPPEAVVQTRFSQLFPNLSRRSSERSSASAMARSEPTADTFANTAQAEASANQAVEATAVSSAPAAEEPSALVEAASPTPESVASAPVRSTAKVDWAMLSANSAGVASVIAALAAVSDAEVVSAAEVRAESSKPQSAGRTEAESSPPAVDSGRPEAGTQLVERKADVTPPVVTEPVASTPPAISAPGAIANAPAIAAEDAGRSIEPSRSQVEAPRTPLTAVEPNEIPATLPPATESANVSTTESATATREVVVPKPEPATQQELAESIGPVVPGIVDSDATPSTSASQAKDEKALQADPVPQVALRENAPAATSTAPLTVTQPIVEPPVKVPAPQVEAAAVAEVPQAMPEVPAIPADTVKEIATAPPQVTVQSANPGVSTAVSEGSSEPAKQPGSLEVPPIPTTPAPEPVVPGLPSIEPNGREGTQPAAAPTTESPAPPSVPAKAEDESKTLEIPGVPAAAPASVESPNPPANVPAAAEPMATPGTSASITVTAPDAAPAPAVLPGNLSEPPPPAPAPELQVPGISEPPVAAEPPAHPADTPSPSDAGVERSSASGEQNGASQTVAPSDGSSDSGKGSDETPAAAGNGGTGADEAIPVLSPLPDDEAALNSEERGSAIERKPGELVIRLRLSNPFRSNRFRAMADDQPSTSRGLKSAARSLFTWQRSPKAEAVEPDQAPNLLAETLAPAADSQPTAEVTDQSMVTQESQATDEAVANAAPATVSSDVDTSVATQSHTESVEKNPEPASESPEAVQRTAIAEPARRPSRIAAFFVPGRTQADVAPARTSNGLPAVEFPASYRSAPPRSANPWYAHAKPAVNPVADPRRDMAPVTSAPAAPAPAMPVTKTESKPALRPDLEVVRTSLNVPTITNPVVPAASAPASKTNPIEKDSPSWWSNRDKSFRQMIFGEEEVVPAKRPNWATRKTSAR